ncbi:MAG TPA: hypothetical protein VFY94_11930 [Rhodanobacteraceae bacterium]|nr:hypothetical protein [Rhodanobacteraceae bacterium]
MTSITAQILIFSGRMPGKPMRGLPAAQNRVRDQRFHFPVVPDDRKMLARLRAGPGRRMPKSATAADPEKSISMRSERGMDGQVSD